MGPALLLGLGLALIMALSGGMGGKPPEKLPLPPKKDEEIPGLDIEPYAYAQTAEPGEPGAPEGEGEGQAEAAPGAPGEMYEPGEAGPGPAYEPGSFEPGPQIPGEPAQPAALDVTPYQHEDTGEPAHDGEPGVPNVPGQTAAEDITPGVPGVPAQGDAVPMESPPDMSEPDAGTASSLAQAQQAGQNEAAAAAAANDAAKKEEAAAQALKDAQAAGDKDKAAAAAAAAEQAQRDKIEAERRKNEENAKKQKAAAEAEAKARAAAEKSKQLALAKAKAAEQKQKEALARAAKAKQQNDAREMAAAKEAAKEATALKESAKVDARQSVQSQAEADKINQARDLEQKRVVVVDIFNEAVNRRQAATSSMPILNRPAKTKLEQPKAKVTTKKPLTDLKKPTVTTKVDPQKLSVVKAAYVAAIQYAMSLFKSKYKPISDNQAYAMILNPFRSASTLGPGFPAVPPATDLDQPAPYWAQSLTDIKRSMAAAVARAKSEAQAQMELAYFREPKVKQRVAALATQIAKKNRRSAANKADLTAALAQETANFRAGKGVKIAGFFMGFMGAVGQRDETRQESINTVALHFKRAGVDLSKPDPKKAFWRQPVVKIQQQALKAANTIPIPKGAKKPPLLAQKPLPPVTPVVVAKSTSGKPVVVATSPAAMVKDVSTLQAQMVQLGKVLPPSKLKTALVAATRNPRFVDGKLGPGTAKAASIVMGKTMSVAALKTVSGRNALSARINALMASATKAPVATPATKPAQPAPVSSRGSAAVARLQQAIKNTPRPSAALARLIANPRFVDGLLGQGTVNALSLALGKRFTLAQVRANLATLTAAVEKKNATAPSAPAPRPAPVATTRPTAAPAGVSPALLEANRKVIAAAFQQGLAKRKKAFPKEASKNAVNKVAAYFGKNGVPLSKPNPANPHPMHRSDPKALANKLAALVNAYKPTTMSGVGPYFDFYGARAPRVRDEEIYSFAGGLMTLGGWAG